MAILLCLLASLCACSKKIRELPMAPVESSHTCALWEMVPSGAVAPIHRSMHERRRTKSPDSPERLTPRLTILGKALADSPFWFRHRLHYSVTPTSAVHNALP
jgi:hypothetical protein